MTAANWPQRAQGAQRSGCVWNPILIDRYPGFLAVAGGNARAVCPATAAAQAQTLAVSGRGQGEGVVDAAAWVGRLEAAMTA